jgi:hypothetical protein
MCCGIRPHIDLTVEDLPESENRSGGLRQQFWSFHERTDIEPEAMEDWLVRPRVPHIQQLARLEITRKLSSLQSYFNPQTYFFGLEGVDGVLMARRLPDDPSMTALLKLRVFMSNPAV